MADLTTPIPDQPGQTFWGFAQPTVSDSRILFSGATPLGPGLYEAEAESLIARVPPDTLAPNGLPIVGFSVPLIDGPRLAFIGATAANPATLYLSRGAGLERVLAQGDMLDGQQVLAMTHRLSGGVLAARILFADSSQALYAADLRDAVEVPTLTPTGALALALLLLAAGLVRLRWLGAK